MRPITARTRLGLATTTAVIGSVSLSLGASPAVASERGADAVQLHRAVTVPPATAARATSAEAAPATYEIRSGDTVSAVAARFGLRTEDVLAWNALGWSTIIRPGQVLRLTDPTASAAPAAAAPAATPAAAAAPAPTSAAHTVVAGDTLWAIAQAGGVSLDALLAANGLTRESIIYPGQTLAMPSAAAVAVVQTAAASSPVALDEEQAANARIIIGVGRELGVSDRGIAIALATAMVESRLQNLAGGDRDSVGLFQQRPSMGWGTATEAQDARRAASAFYGGPTDPNGTRTRGLLDIPGWESLDFGDAAQAVQISAFPERYGPWEASATAWLAALG